MIRIERPSDYRDRGRTVWVNPEEIVSITRDDYCTYDECRIQLKDGREIKAAISQHQMAEMVNKALSKPAT